MDKTAAEAVSIGNVLLNSFAIKKQTKKGPNKLSYFLVSLPYKHCIYNPINLDSLPNNM